MNYEELVEALRYCVNARNCKKCAYRINNNSVKCRIQRVEEAADAIVALGLDNEDYEHENRRLHGEIEALQADMKTYGKTAFDEGYAMGFAAGEDRAEKQMPKRGEWKRVEDGETYHYECSECGERPLYSRFGDIVLSGVCPMCGAKMEVQDGE